MDVEKAYATRDVVAKLRRLADALEAGKPFAIQIAGKRITMPPDVTIEFEYARAGDEEEIEIELTWTRKQKDAAEDEPAEEEPAQERPAGILALVGSAQEAARAQVERLSDEGALVLTLSREAVLNEDETFLMGIRSGAAAALKQGRHVVVRSENWPGAAEVTRRMAAKRAIPPEEVERRVATMLARVGEGVLAATGGRRLAVVGTETGAALCRQLNLAELLPLGEAAPGVPALLAAGDQPLLLVWKPGGSGEPEALSQAIGWMSSLRIG
ncbi:MAG: amphi-Trp domain-containing protein [Bacillota bacterium]